MKSVFKIIMGILFMTGSVILGNFFLKEPEFSLIRRQLVDYYLSVYNSAKNKPHNCTIAFGYTGCQDRKIDALELIGKLNASFTPKEKMRLLTIQDFVSTFAFYFQNGAASEYFMANQESFDQILEISSGLKYQTTFGGHAPHMALRAAKELCNAVLVAQIGETEINEITNLDTNKKITFVGATENNQQSDIHLIFEYPANSFENITSPRANRFYLNRDVQSANLSSLENYKNAVISLNVTKHAVAGFQMTQTLETENAILRIEAVQKQWEFLRKIQPQTIHMELAAFSNSKIYEKTVESLVQNADSLGVNEQEIQTLHKYLKMNKLFVAIGNPYLKIEEMLIQIYDIIEELDKRNSYVTRIHTHGISEHYVCYKGIFS